MPVSEQCAEWVEQRFAQSIVPTLQQYIAIPNKSPSFDAAWKQAGHMDRAVELLAGWAREAMPEGATLEVVADDPAAFHKPLQARQQWLRVGFPPP